MCDKFNYLSMPLTALSSKHIIHHLDQAKQMKMDRICIHLPRKICFETPPSEASRHEGMHLGFPSLGGHRQLQI